MIGSLVALLVGGAAAAASPAVVSRSTVPDREIAAAVAQVQPRLVVIRRDIHSHPELSNREYRTGKLVAERLRALGLEVHYPVAKTGAVGILRGGKPGRVVAVRADLDALPVNEVGDATYRSLTPGVMHACGHDVHTSIGLGVAEVLARLKDKVPGTVVFLFQPAEEGAPDGEEGGASVMVSEGALDSPKVEAVFGIHVDPLLDQGKVGWAAGPLFASSDRFVIDIKGRRTHGAYPHTGIDPVPVAAEVVLALEAMVARETDAQRPKVVTIGKIEGGERSNIVAEKVRMEGTMRALDGAMRKDLQERIARVVTHVAKAHGAEGELRFATDGNPVLMNDEALVRRLVPSLERALGRDAVVEVRPQMGAEDFAFFAERVPAFYCKLGVRNEAMGLTAMVHTERFDVDEAVIGVGVKALTTLVWVELTRR